MTQSQDYLRLIDEFQYTHAIHYRDHSAQSHKAHEDTIAYKRWTPQDDSRYDTTIIDDLAHDVKSLDISRSK